MPGRKGQRRSEGQVDHSRRAYKGIRRMLYHKELVPGQKIGCRDLGERLNMSPTPIIQALKLMEFKGFVRHEPNRGYYMEPITLKELEEIYELRQLLEPSLLQDTIRLMDAEGEGRLRKAVDAHLSAVREVYLKERLFKNVEFHLTLASLSGRHTQLRILRDLFDVLFLKYGGHYLPTVSMKSVDQDHQKIFNCVVSRDVKGAREILLRHITHVKKQVLAIFKQILEEEEVPEF